jgi:SAM-dependent methyltransferase
MTSVSDYALKISDNELQRYRAMAASAQQLEAELWHTAGIGPRANVVDLGCGPGAMLLALAEHVGPTGSVIGVDADAPAIAVAENLIAAAGLANARVQVGDATTSGLASASADVVVLRHVLAHNQRIEADLVTHAGDLVRPGGCVYLVDVDATMIRHRGAPPEFDELRESYRAWHASRGNDLQVGLRLPALLAAAGLDLVTDTAFLVCVDYTPGMRTPAWAARDAMVQAGFADADALERWEAAFAAMDVSSTPPRSFLSYFVAVGRRP